MKYAPIALFTYNRPDKTQRVLESLMQNAEAKDSDLFIFSDGPKNEKAVEGVKQNREYLKSLTSNQFKSITIIEREKNWGLANSLIAGITEVINKYGRVIVVEDDLVLSPYFLKFMNDGLEKYEYEEKVGAITGFVYPVEGQLPETFFLHYFHCWGWATWNRSWNLLNKDANDLIRQMRFKKMAFDCGGYSGNYANLLCQKKGLIDSWWVRFYASLYLANKLVLYPYVSVSSNDGFGEQSTHTTSCEYISEVKLAKRPIQINEISIEECKKAFDLYHQFFKKQHTSEIKFQFSRFKSFLRRLLFIDSL